MSLSIDEDADCLLDELIAQFLEIADRGNLESAHSLIARYPQYRDELTQFQRDHERIVERRRAIELSRTHDGQSVNATVLVSAGDQSDATITFDPDRIEKHGFPVEFGRYRIERPLAKGAMGSIYVAIDTLLGRTIALKIPRFQGDERELAARFLREARSAAALNHRSICPIFDFGEIDGQQYLSMPLIEGHALSTAMANRS